MKQEIVSDTRGQVGMGASQRAVSVIVSIVVASLLAAFLLPIAIEEIAAVSTDTWPEGAVALWGVLPILIVLAIFLFFVQVAVRSG